MPGIVASVSRVEPAGSVATALDRLCHFDFYHRLERRVHDRVGVGMAMRDAIGERNVASCDGVDVFLSGTAFTARGEPRSVLPEEICRAYREGRAFDPDTLDGSFTLVIFDRVRRVLTVANDRTGSVPVYYAHGTDTFHVAPEAKAIFALIGGGVKYSLPGVLSFVNNGYCLGATTVFDGIAALEPGSVLEVGVDDLTVARRRYWRMEFAPDASLNRRRHAEGALREAILAGHRRVLADGVTAYDVLLSGGMDSRLIIAALDRLGRPPRRAFGWGMTEDLPGSDPHIAAQIASAHGVKFDFLAYDTDQFLANARSWAWLSELANDNIGWYAEGAPVLAGVYRCEAQCMLTGDECWGGRGFVRTPAEIRAAVLPDDLAPALRAMMKPAFAGECTAILDREVDAVVDQCKSSDPLARRDFLYMHGRLARFVFSLGYYKEIAVELRRPFLALETLDVVRALPGRYRVFKNLFLSMIRHDFPRAARYPDAYVDSLPDWPYQLRAEPALRAFVSGLLETERVMSGPLGELIDADAFERERDAFLNEAVHPDPRLPEKNRSLLARVLPPQLKRGSVLVDRARRALGRGTRPRARSTFHAFMALALVNLFNESSRGNGGRGGSPR